MKIQGNIITMHCPTCNTKMFCGDIWLKDFSQEELGLLNSRENWDRKIEYSFYCDHCNVNVVSESYIIHDKKYKTEG